MVIILVPFDKYGFGMRKSFVSLKKLDRKNSSDLQDKSLPIEIKYRE